jgi:non-ribosomal peptide synthase protein (TIGR01720 family)
VLIFQHQTLEALAKAVNTTSKNIKEIEVEQSLVVGEVPLTPIQYRFFERNLQEPNHWNQSLYLELSQPLSQALIQRALTMLVEHHDALRLRFHQEHGNQWQQENIGYTNDHEHHAKDSYLHLTWHDLSAYSDEELPSIIDQLALVAQSSLDISNGPLLKAVYFSLDTSHNDRLLLVIHHLAVDGVSWRILLEDLETLIHQFINEQPGSLPAKTTSYRDWAQQLQSYAQSQQIQAELSYWQTQTTIEGGTLPHDSISEEASKKNTVGSTERLLATMNAEDTQKLLHDIRVVHHAQMHEFLLAALFTTITHWSGTETLLIDLEGHGREEHIGNVDLSRTVGWFTTVYPVCLQRSTRNTAVDEVLQQVKQSIRQIPAKGLGYGLLRYLTSQDNGSSPLAGATQAEICFNYLGQFDQKTATPHYVKIREEACGSDMSLLAERLYLFELDISIVNDQLLVVWTYSRNLHTEQTVQLLMQEFLQTLRQFMITTRPKAEQVQSLVPSDFPLATVTQNQLDTLLAKYGRIEDVYGLPPIQSCMLQRSIHAPRYGQYLYQWSLDLNRRLEEATFVQSWQEIVNEQPAWRTAFSWSESGDMLLQVVQQEVQLPVIRFDWRTLPAEKQEQQENSYLQHTQQQGFDLSQPPLLSLALARLAEARYKVIMTFSLLVVDVPSFALLLDAVLQRYEQLCKRQQAQRTTQIADSSEISSQDLPERTAQGHPSYSYKEYIEWVQQQDEEAARAFWQHYLKGFSSPTPLLAQMASTDAAIRKGYIDHFIFLSDELTSALQKFARRHQFTLYSILQGIWAIYLKEATGHNDVVYGTIVSGRPTALENAQYRIGRFVNFVPIRMHIPESGTFVNWVKAAQKSLFELLQYEYVSAEQINEWCGFERYRHCYHSLVAYENAPLQDLIAAPHWQGANALKIIQDPEVPIKVTGSLFDRLRITIAYIPTAIEHEKVTAMLERIVTLLEQLVQNEEDGFLFETFNTAH